MAEAVSAAKKATSKSAKFALPHRTNSAAERAKNSGPVHDAPRAPAGRFGGGGGSIVVAGVIEQSLNVNVDER